jgi:hypothetical protein
MTTESLHQPRPIDTLVTNLCDTIADLRERCAALETLATSRGDDAASFRLLAKQALHALHREQQSHARLRERYERIVCEMRDSRGRMPTEQAA